MKAALSVLLHDEPKKVDDIRNLYFRNSTIFMDDKLEEMHENQKSKITKFLERNERDILKLKNTIENLKSNTIREINEKK